MWVIAFGFKLAISSLRGLLESGGGFLEKAFRGHKLFLQFSPKHYTGRMGVLGSTWVGRKERGVVGSYQVGCLGAQG